MNYTGNNCSRKVLGRSVLHIRNKHNVNPSLIELIPEKEYQQAATDTIVEHNFLSSSFIFLNWHSLERECHSRVMHNNTYCTTRDPHPVTPNFCDIVYDGVVNATKNLLQTLTSHLERVEFADHLFHGLNE